MQGQREGNRAGMAIRLNAEDFWAYSLALYCRQTVASACLALQERRGADVNLLLAICWLATKGYVVKAEALGAAEVAVAPWNTTILQPLRQVRRRLPTDFPETAQADRQSIKHGILSVELECERVAQRKIVAALEPLMADLDGAPARDLAAASFSLYLAQLATPDVALDQANIAAILAEI